MATKHRERYEVNPMDVHIHISSEHAQERNQDTLKKDLYEGLIIIDYLNVRLSLGEVAEKLGMSYIETRDWLHKKGIATLREMAPDLEEEAQRNTDQLIKKLQGSP